MTSPQSSAPRSSRADAQRSYRRIVEAAAAVFLRDGAEASLEEIARTAGVGSATLHRHFSSRWALLDAVFAGGIDDLRALADDLLRDSGPDALFAWLRSVGDYCTATRGLAAALLQSGDQKQRASSVCHQTLVHAGAALLDRARDAGRVRPDVTITDLLTLVSAIALAAECAPADGARLVNLAIDGVRGNR
ncbi:MAG: TetR/AcrR family transcriptional regulator [Mycobacterium sp.]